MWGYTAAKLGLSLPDMEFGAQEFVSRQGRKFDEPWEVDAFKDGYYFYQSVLFNTSYENAQKGRKFDKMYSSPYEDK